MQRKKKKRGHYRLNEVEYELMRRLINNGVASLTVDDEKKAQYVRTRIRDVLRHQGCKHIVAMAVRGSVVIAWMLAEYDTHKLNDIIWSAAMKKNNALICGYGRRARLDGGEDKRVLELGVFGTGRVESVDDVIAEFKKKRGYKEQAPRSELSFKTQPTGVQPMNGSTGLDEERLKEIWKENLDAGIFTQEQYDEKVKELDGQKT